MVTAIKILGGIAVMWIVLGLALSGLIMRPLDEDHEVSQMQR